MRLTVCVDWSGAKYQFLLGDQDQSDTSGGARELHAVGKDPPRQPPLALCLVVGIVLTMSTATMDGSRALYGISRSGTTVKLLGTLDKHRVPGRGMALDAAVNIFLVVYFGTAIEILAAGNLGYMLAHVFALSGFVLLRRDRPGWPRPVRLANAWVPIAAALAALNLVFVVFGGFIFADKYGYGLSKTMIGVAVLFISLLLFVYRRVVEDKARVALREDAPAEPSEQERREMLAATPGAPSLRADAAAAPAVGT